MSEKEFEAQLTLKDRLNFPYLLANQILTFQKAILNLEFSEREIREAIEGFVHLIPEAWKDGKFEDAMKEAEITKKIDLRPRFCGVPPSLEYCKTNSLPAFKDQKTFNYYKMFQACINLLDRKKMLSRIVRIEELESIDFESVTEDALRESNLPSE